MRSNVVRFEATVVVDLYKKISSVATGVDSNYLRKKNHRSVIPGTVSKQNNVDLTQSENRE